jgi:glycosyltransferase involved in cell wall biosynthesis
MKLGVVTTCVSKNAGGLYVSVRKMTQAIAACGVDCTIFGLKDEHTAEDLKAWAPLDVCVYPRRGPRFFPVSMSMRKAVLESEPDILHTHGIWLYPSLVDLAARRERKTPYVVSPRGMLDPWAVNNSACKKKLAGWVFENKHLSRAACIHALCESEYKSIRAYGLKNPVCIIPNGVDLPEDRVRLAPPWADVVEGGRKVMLFLGRIHPKKGLPNLIEAWSILKPEEWILAIAGWDQAGHENKLKKLVKDLRLEKDIIFPGPVFDEKKKASLQNVDAFILPSLSEGLPMSVLEAWSYGLPVLMTKECNIPEGFAAKAAVEVKPEPDSIAEGLKSFFSLPTPERKEMGLSGRSLVETKFSWPRIAGEMIGVYQWILGQGPQPECVKLN